MACGCLLLRRRSCDRTSEGTIRNRLLIAALTAFVAILAWAAQADAVQPYEKYEEAVAADTPAAQFRFNDAAGSSTVADSAGSFTATNTGITLGGAGPFEGAKSGSFGGSSYATLAGDPLSGASEFTVEAWVKWAGGLPNEQAILALGSSSSNYMLLTPTGTKAHVLTFELHPASGSPLQVATSSKLSKQWEDVAVTETSAGTVTLYLDGEAASVEHTTLSPASLGSAPDAVLGGSVPGGGPDLSGLLSNVSFYTKALSAERIRQHYYEAEYPINVEKPAITGTAKEGDGLKASEGVWSGLPLTGRTYQWQSCEGTSCVEVGTGSKYEPRSTDVGHKIRVLVTATNNAGSGEAFSELTATVLGTIPNNTEPPVVSGPAEDGRVLTTTEGHWTGTPPPSGLKYAWEECTTKKCTTISGANSPSMRLTVAQVGDTVRSVVTDENGFGTQSAKSEPTATVTTAIPLNEVPPQISGEAHEGDTLTATPGTWYGTGTTEYSYRWQSCNHEAHCTQATGASYTLSSADVGNTVLVEVTATNVVGSATASSAPTATVTGNPPSNTAAPTISGQAREGQTLTASAGTWAGTEPITYGYQWEACSGPSCTAIEGASEASYVARSGDVGKTLQVTVTAHNSVGTSSRSSSATATVAGNPPANTLAPAISGTPESGHTLTASEGTWTGTPTIAYAYQWQRCKGGECQNISGATGSSYRATDQDVGSALQVTVTVSNGIEPAGTAHSEQTEAVKAAPPVNETAPKISGEAQVGQTLTASEGTWAGTPTITYSYQWETCGNLEQGCVPISGATEPTYKVTPLVVGTTLEVAVTATNAGGSATASSAQTATVTGNPPSNTSAPTISGQALEGKTLTASEGAWTGTEPITYGYRWEACSGSSCTAIGGATKQTYKVTTAVGGKTLEVAVTATNAAGSATATSAQTAKVPVGGAAVAWGENNYGGDGQIYKDTRELTAVGVEELPNITSISDGSSVTLARLANGEVASWGSGAHGQLGNNGLKSNWQFGTSHVIVKEFTGSEKLEPLENATAVAASGEHAMALIGQGEHSKVDVWGNNGYGTLANGRSGAEIAAVPRQVSELSGVKSIAEGGGSDYAVLENGTAVAWGSNTVGQLGVEGWPEECEQRLQCEKKHEAEYKEGAYPFLCHVLETGPELCSKKPRFIGETGKRVEHIKEIVAGYEAAYAVIEPTGEVESWGNNAQGALGQAGLKTGSNTSFTPPGLVTREPSKGVKEPLKNVVELSAGYNHVVARLSNGEVVGWGGDDKGQLGGTSSEICQKKPETECFKTWRQITALPGPGAEHPVEAVAAGSKYTLALINHQVFAFGADGEGQLGINSWHGPNTCLTANDKKKYKEKEEKIESSAKKKEEEGKNVKSVEEKELKEVKNNEEHAGSCSRARVEVKEHNGAALEHVQMIAAAPGHAVAVLEPGVVPPQPILTVGHGEEEGHRVLKLEWTPPKYVEKLTYHVFEHPGLQEAEPEPEEPGASCLPGEECGVVEGEVSGPPQNVVAPFIRHNPELLNGESKSDYVVGQHVEVVEGKWLGTKPITFIYQWERCTVYGECTPIGEPTTNAQYVITSADIEDSLRVTVSATNSQTTEPVVVKSEITPLVKKEHGSNLDVVNELPESAYTVEGYRASQTESPTPLKAGVGYEFRLVAGENGENTMTTVLTP